MDSDAILSASKSLLLLCCSESAHRVRQLEPNESSGRAGSRLTSVRTSDPKPGVRRADLRRQELISQLRTYGVRHAANRHEFRQVMELARQTSSSSDLRLVGFWPHESLTVTLGSTLRYWAGSSSCSRFLYRFTPFLSQAATPLAVFRRSKKPRQARHGLYRWVARGP